MMVRNSYEKNNDKVGWAGAFSFNFLVTACC